MAFTTSNVKTASLAGAFRMVVGDWTGVAGDAPGTLQVAAGKIYGYQFLTMNSSGPDEIDVKASPSGTSGIVTLTVYNKATVNAGQFSVICA